MGGLCPWSQKLPVPSPICEIRGKQAMVLTQEAGFGSGREEREPDGTEHVLRAKSPGFSLPLVLERAVWSQRGPCRSDRRGWPVRGRLWIQDGGHQSPTVPVTSHLSRGRPGALGGSVPSPCTAPESDPHARVPTCSVCCSGLRRPGRSPAVCPHSHFLPKGETEFRMSEALPQIPGAGRQQRWK